MRNRRNAASPSCSPWAWSRSPRSRRRRCSPRKAPGRGTPSSAPSTCRRRRWSSAGVDWARALLSEDRRVSSVDHLGEPWALRLPPVPVDNGELAGQIDDQQGAFNLNNLYRNGKAEPGACRAVSPAAGDPRPARRARRCAASRSDRPLVDVAELALVPGFDAAVRARLRPFVTALPRFTLGQRQHRLARGARRRGPRPGAGRCACPGGAAQPRLFPQPERIPGAAARRAPSSDGNDITTASQFFLASVRVTIGDAQARGSALLARDATGLAGRRVAKISMSLLRIYAPLGEAPSRCEWVLIDERQSRAGRGAACRPAARRRARAARDSRGAGADHAREPAARRARGATHRCSRLRWKRRPRPSPTRTR